MRPTDAAPKKSAAATSPSTASFPRIEQSPSRSCSRSSIPSPRNLRSKARRAWPHCHRQRSPLSRMRSRSCWQNGPRGGRIRDHVSGLFPVVVATREFPMLNPERQGELKLPQKPADPRFKLLSSTVVPLTPEVLADFKAIESGNLERDLNEGRVKYLQEKYLAGQFLTLQWIVAHIKSTGKKVRANGQHSSEMLTRQDPFPVGVTCHIEAYEVADANRFAELFQQIDARRSARNSYDNAGVYQAINEELNDVDRSDAKIAVDGYAWYMHTVERASMPIGDMKYSAFSDNNLHPYIRWVASVLNGKTPELRRKEVVGAMFATFSVNEPAAREFWQEVGLRGDLEQPDLPQTCLDQWLLDQYQGEIDKVSGVPLFAGCVHAWNTSRDDKRIVKIRPDIRKITPRD